jgi:hypothetical protein
LRAKRGNPEVKKHLSSLNIAHDQYLFLFWNWYKSFHFLLFLRKQESKNVVDPRVEHEDDELGKLWDDEIIPLFG